MDTRTPGLRNILDSATVGFPAAAEDYVLRVQRFYDARARWHRRFYRSTGVLLIVVGASMPLLTSLDYPNQSLVLSASGLLVALLTGLRAFYQWDQSWVLLRNTEFAISKAYWEWKGSPPETAPDDVPAPERNEAAVRMLMAVLELREKEAESYFRDLAWPRESRV